MTIPTFIPLNEAAARTGWTVERLRELVAAGTIMAGKLPDGDIIVAVDESGTAIETPTETSPDERELPLAAAGDDINAQLSAIKREDFKHLEGQGITVSEAAKKYGVPYETIRSWLKRYPGHIKILASGYRKQIDESAIAYFVAIYKVWKSHGIRPGMGGLVNGDGNPTLLKHPSISRYRRSKRP